MSMPLNAKLLTKLVQWADEDNERFKKWGTWDQAVWARQTKNGVCKTAYCIAGQAVVQSGYVLIYHPKDDECDRAYPRSAYNCAPAIPDGLDEKGNLKYTYRKEDTIPIETVAKTVLGLTDDEATTLFHGENTFKRVRQLAKRIAKRRGIVLEV